MYGFNRFYHGLQGYAAGLTAIGKASQKCYSSMFSSIIHTEANKLEEIENILEHDYIGDMNHIDTQYSIQSLNITPEHPILCVENIIDIGIWKQNDITHETNTENSKTLQKPGNAQSMATDIFGQRAIILYKQWANNTWTLNKEGFDAS